MLLSFLLFSSLHTLNNPDSNEHLIAASIEEKLHIGSLYAIGTLDFKVNDELQRIKVDRVGR